MRWLWFSISFVARLGAVLAAKAILILAIVAVSLSFSVASFAVPALASTLWRTAAWAFGPPAVASVAETQRLRQQNQVLQRNNRNLIQSNNALNERNRALGERNRGFVARNQDLDRTNTRQAQTNSILNADNQRLTANNGTLQRQLSGYRQVTARTTRQVGERAVRMTTRSIAAIPLESAPVLGISMIIATTAWDISDTCRTLDDMAAIQEQLGLDPDRSFAARACDTFPLRRARVVHYGEMSVSECRAEAEAARDRVFDLADQTRAEVPDIVGDTSVIDADSVQTAADEFDAINLICDCIADLACDPEDLARR